MRACIRINKYFHFTNNSRYLEKQTDLNKRVMSMKILKLYEWYGYKVSFSLIFCAYLLNNFKSTLNKFS